MERAGVLISLYMYNSRQISVLPSFWVVQERFECCGARYQSSCVSSTRMYSVDYYVYIHSLHPRPTRSGGTTREYFSSFFNYVHVPANNSSRKRGGRGRTHLDFVQSFRALCAKMSTGFGVERGQRRWLRGVLPLSWLLIVSTKISLLAANMHSAGHTIHMKLTSTQPEDR